MDSFFDNAERAQRFVTILVFLVLAVGVWLGRKRWRVVIPVALFVFVVAAMVIPSAVGARQASERNSCINNLRQINRAKQEWAQQNQKQPTDTPIDNDLFGSTSRHQSSPICPVGGSYTFGTAGENPTCSLAHRGHKLE